MTRLRVIVEGQTEEQFVGDSLAPHLQGFGVYAAATIVGKLHAQRGGHQQRGGGRFRHWYEDIRRTLGEDRNDSLRVTTLFDLYGLPSDFPEFELHRTVADTNVRCDRFQVALATVVNDYRFISYLQRHEFESLVLASLPSLARVFDADDDLEGVARLGQELRDTPPEDINDGRETAPSKRLMGAIPSYTKPLYGPLAVGDTGLAAVRARCPRFDAWVRQLEGLSAQPLTRSMDGS